jgi:TonB-linked SusC/RagA family outer membrane protein
MKYVFNQGVLSLAAIMMTALCATAQITVTGTVQDATGEPLIGVSIMQRGTTRGTVTDLEGQFSLTIPDSEARLVFSYTGFRTQEVNVGAGTTNLNILLDEDIARLEEVIVTGLASGVKRSNLGNAITTVSADELMGSTTPQTLDYALYGKIPGVTMNANGGSPGGGINVQLRGVSTLGSGASQPLYIIDGVYINNTAIRNGRTQVSGAGAIGGAQDDAANRIADVNPEDIERIEVLKGPSAAAIYGTRANAGVIIITTKKGQAGRTRVSLSQDVGIAQGQNFVGFDPWDEAKIRTFFSGARQQLELERYQQALAENRLTNWEEFFYGETGLLTNTQLSVSGGSGRTQFYVAGGVQNEEGIIKNTDFQRLNLRANIDHSIGERVKISFNNTYVKTDNNRGFTGNQNNTGGSIGYNIAFAPTYANFFPDAQGNYPNNPYFNDNPIAIRELGINNQNVDRFITAANLDFDLMRRPLSFLKLRVNGGVDFLSGNSQVYFPEVLQHQRAMANSGDVMWGNQDDINTNLQGFLIFNTNLRQLNSNTSLGMVRLDQKSNYLLSRGRGLTGGQDNLQWAKVQSTASQVNQRVTDIGLVLQEDLNWDDKINLSLGIRLDKSTLNVQQNKYYAFPKASLALNLSNFGFWGIDAVNLFKLRAAYGETGGLPNFGVIFESLAPQVIGNLTGAQVGVRGVDPNLRPETAQEIELGFDAGLFKDRLTLEATYYNKRVKDLILDLQPAESTGILAIATNAADLENRGIELGLGINPVRSFNFNWLAKILWWRNVSEMTRLDIPTFTTGGFGPALGSYLIAEGFSPTTIIGNPADPSVPGGRTVYGDRQPDFQMSWFNQINFLRNFDFSFLFHWKKGGDVINLSALLWDQGGNSPGWNNDSDNNEIPDGRQRLLTWAGGNTGVYIEDGSYIKLRELGLYYTIPMSGSSLVQRIKVGASANNILLWTPYSSYDPEVSNFGSLPIGSNIEVTPFPSSRRLFFHLKLDF